MSILDSTSPLLESEIRTFLADRETIAEDIRQERALRRSRDCRMSPAIVG